MYDQLKASIQKDIMLNPELWNELKKRSIVINLRKNEFLIKQDEICQHGYFLNKGSLIQSFQNENGKEVVLGFYIEHVYSFISSPNSYFNNIGSTFEIKALEDCILISFHKRDLEFLSREFPEFGIFYHKITATALHNMYIYTSMRLSLSAEEFFIFLKNNYPAYLQRIPDKYVARFIGVSKEWYSKLKNKIIKY